MAKKKVIKKTKKKAPEFKCCGVEDHKCSNEDCKCNENKVEVFVCPRCQSVEVGYTFGLRNIFGIIPRMKCKTCGFSATAFPKWIIDSDKLPTEHQKIKNEKIKEKKNKKTDFKTKVEEKYCPNCKDKVQVKMKDGSLDVFICENCKFEIKKGKKKK